MSLPLTLGRPPAAGEPAVLECRHFDADRCRSCTLLGVPYAVQLEEKDAAVRERLAGVTDAATVWEPPVASPAAGFRNKAKLVVTGTADEPRLGILDPAQRPRHHDGTGWDLSDCPLYEPGMETVFGILAQTIRAAGLVPYDVASRTGELKNLIVTLSPGMGDGAQAAAGPAAPGTGDGAGREVMVRFVLRSPDSLPALRAAVPGMCAALAAAGTPAAVVTANLLPAHVALPEGPEEVHLAGAETLRMELNGIGLRLRPQGFFQTNTPVTRRLYATAAAWLAEAADDATDGAGSPVASAWDLYCGVGGFAFHLARPRADGGAGVEHVYGLETSEDAIAAARLTAVELGLEGSVLFEAGDATALPERAREVTGGVPDAVVVNPPRRGIGPELAAWLEASGVPHVLYSSCNAASLAADLAALPGYRVVRAQVFDMFPQTGHAETLVRLARR